MIDEDLITKEVLGNTVKQEIYPQIKVVDKPRMGKVRSVYDVGDDILIMISSDNLSTHDVVHKRQVYAKGENLDAISSHYFNRTKNIVENHYLETLTHNTGLVEKAEPILVEMVFRKYLSGSAWKSYIENQGPEKGMEFCGAYLREGYRKNEILDELIFTPTAKGQVRDFPIEEFKGMDPNEDDPKITVEIIRKNYKYFGLKKAEDLDYLIDVSFELYNFLHEDLKSKGHLLADTKWEFGYLSNNRIGLIDECVTPDSSRLWTFLQYRLDPEKNEFVVVQDDKQHFRDHIESLGLHKQKKELAEYWMPDDILKQGVVKYCNIRETITGTLPEITTQSKKQRILDAIENAGYLKEAENGN